MFKNINIAIVQKDKTCAELSWDSSCAAHCWLHQF